MIELVQGREYDVRLPSISTDYGRAYSSGQFVATFEARREISSVPQPDDGVVRDSIPSYVFRNRRGQRIEVDEPHLEAAEITPMSTPNIPTRTQKIVDGGPDHLTKDDDPFEF